MFDRACVVAAAMLLVSMWPGKTHAAGEVSDYVLGPVPGASSTQSSGPTSQFEFMFGTPAKWRVPLHWSYNHAGAPVQFSDAKGAVIQQIVAESAKWTAACGIQIVYDGETEAVPQTLAGGPDGISVVGWQEPDMGISGAAYVWYQYGSNGQTLVESDMMLDPRYVTTFDQMTRTVSHEWGHAIGLGHSNVEGALMSGPPDSMYTNGTDLTADDVHGCRCLYGPPAGQQAGNVCSLPEVIDFGTLAVGSTSSEKAVTLTNSGNAALVMSDIQPDSSEFLIGTNGCSPGSSLAPGTSCTFGLQARLASAGDRSGEVTINTSEGPYRIPLEATGIGVGAQPPPAPNYEGLWWNAPGGSESGWGINFAHQGDVIFATWFTYDATGKAWWLTMTADKAAEGVYSGTLYKTTGAPFSAFVPPAAHTAVGIGTVTFDSTTTGTFAYAVNDGANVATQTKSIVLQTFGPAPTCVWGAQTDLAAATNYQDLWWAAPAASESGWGMNLTHQGTTIFATWFTYDANHNPLWLSGTLPQTAPKTYSGPLLRSGGQAFNATQFDPDKITRTQVGTAMLTFTDGNTGTFTYNVDLGDGVNKAAQSKAITREVFRAPGTVCQ